jgi:hemerythrin
MGRRPEGGMEWNESLATGIRTIDSQHKELFKRINNLVLAIKQQRCRSEIDGVLKFLEDYARIHFADEEKHMHQSAYPGYEEQRAEHRKYLQALDELKQQAALPRVSGASYDLSATTNQVVVDWIVAHIMQLDMKFAKFLKDRGTADS